MITLYFPILLVLQVRQDSNLQHPVLETGALAVGATDLCNSLFEFYLSMQCVFAQIGRIFLKGNFNLIVHPVFGGGIVNMPPFTALQTNVY